MGNSGIPFLFAGCGLRHPIPPKPDEFALTCTFWVAKTRIFTAGSQISVNQYPQDMCVCFLFCALKKRQTHAGGSKRTPHFWPAVRPIRVEDVPKQILKANTWHSETLTGNVTSWISAGQLRACLQLGEHQKRVARWSSYL